MKKTRWWVAAVIALCASAAIVQTWSTSAPIEAGPAPRTVKARHVDILLPAPPAPVRRAPVQAFTEAPPAKPAGGLGALKTKAGWMGAGLLAGHFIGPAGSVGVGAAKYREDLKAGGKRRFGAIGKIGVPVALSVLAGPIGTAGYAGFQHRSWLKKHVLRIGNDDDKEGKGKDSKAKKLSKDNRTKDDDKKADKRAKDDEKKLKAAKTKAKAAVKAD